MFGLLSERNLLISKVPVHCTVGSGSTINSSPLFGHTPYFYVYIINDTAEIFLPICFIGVKAVNTLKLFGIKQQSSFSKSLSCYHPCIYYMVVSHSLTLLTYKNIEKVTDL